MYLLGVFLRLLKGTLWMRPLLLPPPHWHGKHPNQVSLLLVRSYIFASRFVDYGESLKKKDKN